MAGWLWLRAISLSDEHFQLTRLGGKAKQKQMWTKDLMKKGLQFGMKFFNDSSFQDIGNINLILKPQPLPRRSCSTLPGFVCFPFFYVSIWPRKSLDQLTKESQMSVQKDMTVMWMFIDHATWFCILWLQMITHQQLTQNYQMISIQQCMSKLNCISSLLCVCCFSKLWQDQLKKGKGKGWRVAWQSHWVRLWKEKTVMMCQHVCLARHDAVLYSHVFSCFLRNANLKYVPLFKRSPTINIYQLYLLLYHSSKVPDKFCFPTCFDLQINKLFSGGKGKGKGKSKRPTGDLVAGREVCCVVPLAAEYVYDLTVDHLESTRLYNRLALLMEILLHLATRAVSVRTVASMVYWCGMLHIPNKTTRWKYDRSHAKQRSST